MRKLLAILLLHVCCGTFSQPVKEKLSSEIETLEADSQCRHGLISLYVVDTKTGAVIFSKNASTGLTPASCQKVITSVTAFELLGKDYTYKTTLGYEGIIDKGILAGDVIISGSCDPTLGSWRYESTSIKC